MCSFPSLQVPAFQVEVPQQDLVVVLGNLGHLVVLVDGWEPEHLLAVFDDHHSGQLLGEAAGVDFVLLGQLGQLADIDAQELQLLGGVLVGVPIPQLLGLCQKYRYEGAGEGPVGVELDEIHHLVAVLEVQKLAGLLLPAHFFLHQLLELLLGLDADELVWRPVLGVGHHRPQHHTDHYVVETVFELGKEQQARHAYLTHCQQIQEELSIGGGARIRDYCQCQHSVDDGVLVCEPEGVQVLEGPVAGLSPQSQVRVRQHQGGVYYEVGAHDIGGLSLHPQYYINIPMRKLLAAALLCLLTGLVQAELTVAIIGSNDIHGKAFPTLLSRQDTGQKYKYGGLVYMASLIQTVIEQNQGNAIYLDAGDQFQGGIESSKLISNGEIMNDFYNFIKAKGSSLGNHEFDFGPQFLLPYMNGKQSLNLAANLRSQSGQLNFLPKQKSSTLIPLPNGIKIGIIGLSTLETPTTTSGFSGGKFPMYRFLQYKQTVIQESSKLRKAGAHAVLILSHIGDACPIDLVYANRTKDTQEEPCPEDEISLLIDQLPQGVIDGIVQGHRHRMAHHYHKGIPYMGTINGGYYFNVMYLKFDDNKKVIGSLIEGPIPVCQKVFENLGRCNYLSKEELQTAGDLVNWQFHKKDVVAQPQLQEIYNIKWAPKMAPFLQYIVDNEVYLVKQQNKQSPVANLFTTLIHQAVPSAGFVIVNPGGFRTEWMPGVIQYQHYYNMLPFENLLISFDITGKELLTMLQILQNGEKGFYQAWNIKMEVSLKDGKKGFVAAQFMDGSPIEQDKTYRGVSIDFLLEGGDDFSKVINKTYTVRNPKVEGEYKSLLKPFLAQMEVITMQKLVDPANPRIIVSS